MVKRDNLFFYLLCSLNLLIVVWLFSGGITGNDFWWHVKTGEWIVEHRSIPTEDVFSWLSCSRSLAWTPHEWLAEVVFYFLYHIFGEMGILMCTMSAAVLLNLSAMTLRRENIGRHNLFWGIYFLYSFFLMKIFCCGRPQIFSYCFLFAEMALLYRLIDKPESKCIYWIPLITILWSNFHGGSSNLGYLLILFVLAGCSFNFSFGRLEAGRLPANALVRLGIVFVMAVMGIFVNPVGKKIFLYPYEQMGEKLMLRFISEWQAPDAKSLLQLLLFFVPLLMPILSVMLSKEKIRFVDFLFMLFFTYLFFRSVRFIILYLLAAPFWVSGHVDSIQVKKKEEKGRICGRAVQIFCGVTIGVVMAGAVTGVFFLYRNAEEGEMISGELSKEMLAVIKQEAPRRLFNDYDYGSDLIYAGIPVFYDGRADVFVAAEIFADGNSLVFLNRVEDSEDVEGFDPKDMMEKYQFDGIVIRIDRPLYAYLSSHPESYEKVAEQDGAVYYRVVD